MPGPSAARTSVRRRAGALVATLALAAGLAPAAVAGAGAAAALVVGDCQGSPDRVCRFSGQDRIETAIAASQDLFDAAGTDNGAQAVVLAGSTAFADALSGVPLAFVKGGPLLLTPASGLDSRVLAEIKRVLPAGGKVYLLGGTASLSDTVLRSLKNDGYDVQRVWGPDRYATALAVAGEVGDVASIALASGTDFPDALGAGNAMAGISGSDGAGTPVNGVVLLTQGSTVSPEVADFVRAHPGAELFSVGGLAATAASRAGLPVTASFVGDNRYATAAKVADYFYGSSDATHGPLIAGLASGVAFPDALAGGLDAAYVGAPMLLTSPTTLTSAASSFLSRYRSSIAEVDVYGGTGVVSAGVAGAALSAIR
ncbi:MAG TPA: cell wall-binding repeat-containing protein [Motilibacteraceae bacterium]|nr:cell wall-binding repeat-containing protein [Motilibacteraceae bacterium]